jgi:hypothetical protein
MGEVGGKEARFSFVSSRNSNKPKDCVVCLRVIAHIEGMASTGERCVEVFVLSRVFITSPTKVCAQLLCLFIFLQLTLCVEHSFFFARSGGLHGYGTERERERENRKPIPVAC